MFIDATGGKPLTCSKCGSTDVVKPLNQRGVIARCQKCGHMKLAPEATRGDYQASIGWQHDKDRDNTF